jgi:hypothetical protein
VHRNGSIAGLSGSIIPKVCCMSGYPEEHLGRFKELRSELFKLAHIICNTLLVSPILKDNEIRQIDTKKDFIFARRITNHLSEGPKIVQILEGANNGCT